MTSLVVPRSRWEAARSSVHRSIVVAGLAGVFLTAGSANAESAANRATEVARLRQLLALQYPALREAPARREPPAPVAAGPAAGDSPELEGGASGEAPAKVPAI